MKKEKREKEKLKGKGERERGGGKWLLTIIILEHHHNQWVDKVFLVTAFWHQPNLSDMHLLQENYKTFQLQNSIYI